MKPTAIHPVLDVYANALCPRIYISFTLVVCVKESPRVEQVNNLDIPVGNKMYKQLCREWILFSISYFLAVSRESVITQGFGGEFHTTVFSF